MALLNYSTTVPAERTIAQIQKILAEHGAKAVLTSYGQRGQVEALSFTVDTPQGEIGFRLPVSPSAIEKVLLRQWQRGVQNKFAPPPAWTGPPQTVRVAWRIVKDWIEAQMAIIETEMVTMEQVFLPYAITPTGSTVYELLVAGEFKLLNSGNA